MLDRLLALAQLLLDEGYVDNEADARLGALQILAAVGEPPRDEADQSDGEPTLPAV